jgi:MFS family permease
MGVLADRWGSRVVFVIGHVVLLLTYGVLLSPGEGVAVPVACVALLGAYYAATDGVLAALASAIVPAALRGTGLSIVATGTSAARVLASLAFGVAWTWWGPERSVILFAIALLAGIVVAVGQLRRLNIQP